MLQVSSLILHYLGDIKSPLNKSHLDCFIFELRASSPRYRLVQPVFRSTSTIQSLNGLLSSFFISSVGSESKLNEEIGKGNDVGDCGPLLYLGRRGLKLKVGKRYVHCHSVLWPGHFYPDAKLI